MSQFALTSHPCHRELYSRAARALQLHSFQDSTPRTYSGCAPPTPTSCTAASLLFRDHLARTTSAGHVPYLPENKVHSEHVRLAQMLPPRPVLEHHNTRQTKAPSPPLNSTFLCRFAPNPTRTKTRPRRGADGAKEGESEKENEVTQESLASLVERTFVLAAAGNSYQMGIKAFISTIKEAYERGYTVPALTMEVSFVPTKTAGRDLHQDEVELRSIWIALVYLTLENANWPQKVQRAHEISAPFMVRFFSPLLRRLGSAGMYGGGGDRVRVCTWRPQVQATL